MDVSLGRSGMEVPEEFVCAGRKGAYGNVDRSVGENDDFEFQVVALELFRMGVFVRYVEREGLSFHNGDLFRNEDMMPDGYRDRAR